MDVDNNQKPMWVRVINWISEFSGYISGIAILLATLTIGSQVVIRSMIGLPTIWQTELSIYLLMFATFVGGAYGLKKDSHVGVDIITEKLPPRVKSGLRIVTSCLSILLIIVIAWKGWEMWLEAINKDWHSETLWGPPLAYPYFILPLGMTLMALQYLTIIYEEVGRFKKEKANKTDSYTKIS